MTPGTSMHADAGDRPPLPPPFRARIALTRKQLFGLPILFAIPIIALAGLLGESTGHVVASSHRLELQIDFPSHSHYRQSQALRVAVRNRASQSLDTVKVAFDTAYISAFSQVHFEPSPARAYEVVLPTLGPYESRLVAVELSGNRYGRHAAVITAIAGTDTVRARFVTVVFP